MDRLSFLLDLRYRYLLFAVVIWIVSAVGLLTGEALTRGGIVDRTRDPRSFRRITIVNFLFGPFFFVAFLWKYYGLSL
jgi:hypothetical protein